MTGFSETVELGDVSAVQNDNAVAIQIDLPSVEMVQSRPYWRMLVLDRYAKGGFRMSNSLNSLNNYRFRNAMTVRELRPDYLAKRDRDGDLWTFFMEGGVSRYLPVPGDYAVLRFQVPQDIELIRELRVHGTDKVSQSVFSYQIEDLQFNSRFPAGRQEAYELAGEKASGRLEMPTYPRTTLEVALTSEERATLAEINAILVGGQDLAAAAYSKELTEYLWKNFEYSLQPDGQVPSPNATDPVVNWLREGSRGHCELFASAFVLLARQADYPARLVVGFAGGSWNSVEDYFVIRNRDAHAWVEIFDRDTNEWLRVDPTPGSGSSDPEALTAGNLEFESGWGAWVDSLRIQWYRRIVNFEQKDQVEMAMSFKEMTKAFFEEFSARAKAAMTEFKAWISQPFSAGNLMRGLVVLLFFLSLILIWRARYAFMNRLFRLMRRPKALDPIRRQAGRYLRKIRETHGKEARFPVVRDLQALRFGPEVEPEIAKPIFARARKTLRQTKAKTGDPA